MDKKQLEGDIRDALDKFADTCTGDIDYASGALEVLDLFVDTLKQLEIDSAEDE